MPDPREPGWGDLRPRGDGRRGARRWGAAGVSCAAPLVDAGGVDVPGPEAEPRGVVPRRRTGVEPEVVAARVLRVGRPPAVAGGLAGALVDGGVGATAPAFDRRGRRAGADAALEVVGDFAVLVVFGAARAPATGVAVAFGRPGPRTVPVRAEAAPVLRATRATPAVARRGAVVVWVVGAVCPAVWVRAACRWSSARCCSAAASATADPSSCRRRFVRADWAFATASSARVSARFSCLGVRAAEVDPVALLAPVRAVVRAAEARFVPLTALAAEAFGAFAGAFFDALLALLFAPLAMDLPPEPLRLDTRVSSPVIQPRW